MSITSAAEARLIVQIVPRRNRQPVRAIEAISLAVVGLTAIAAAQPGELGRERLHAAFPDCPRSVCGGQKFDQPFGAFDLSRAGNDGG